MQSEMLRKAREYEEETRRRVLDRLPAFHVTGGVGWINDPNGFSLYKGEYHLFFQYYPYDITWGPMHWGHVKTRDFMRWEQLPASAQSYLKRLSEVAGCPIALVSTGPDRSQTILLKDPFQ